MPKPIMVTLDSVRLDLNKPTFHFRDWLDHVIQIFNSKSVILVFACYSWIFPQYKMMFRGLLVEDVRVFGTAGSVSADNALDEYRMLKYLTVVTQEVTDRTLQAPLIRLRMDHVGLRSETDISKFKCLNLDLEYDDIDPNGGEIINNFVRQMVQSSDSKMESVYFVARRRFLPENFIPEVMDGIEYEEALKEQVRRFYRDFERPYFRGWPEFKGGIDFERKDGVKMTLIYKELGIHVHFVIMLWH